MEFFGYIWLFLSVNGEALLYGRVGIVVMWL